MCFCGSEWLAIGYDDGRIEVFLLKDAATLASHPREVFLGHVGTINSLAYLPNHKLLVSGSSDRTIKGFSITFLSYFLIFSP